MITIYAVSLWLLVVYSSEAFHTRRPQGVSLPNNARNVLISKPKPSIRRFSVPNVSISSSNGSSSAQINKKQIRQQLIKSEGGPLAFNTKYGALNPFAIYYGITSIVLGLVWFVALSFMQLVYKITGDRFDRKRRIPVFLGHCWGTALLALTGSFPKIEKWKIIKEFNKSGRKAMFVSNHNSWMDIPFIGYTIGWQNYKFVAKKELENVPILGKAIMLSRNVCVDRSNRKSQLVTLKQGMRWLDDGVNLCTFPEGTRSKTNRLMPFMGGAFKMAQKAGAPVIPMSIIGAANVMPSHWLFPYRSARGVCKVIVHEPIESLGKTEEELNKEVREKIIEGLPEEQRPLN